MPTIETQRGEIYYTDQGEAAPHTVLLIHGAGGSHLDWPAPLRRLSEARVIALDLPGHDKSAGPSRDTIAAYAADCVALLDALQLNTAVFIGHSMGGGVAMQAALDYPTRVTGLVLLGSGAKLQVHSDILDRVKEDVGAVANTLREWLWGDIATDEMREITHTRLLENPPQVLYNDFLACDNFDIRARLDEIKQPALLIAGENDQMTPRKFSTYLQENLPDAELITVPKAGHMMALEHPGMVTDAVRHWLRGLGS